MEYSMESQPLNPEIRINSEKLSPMCELDVSFNSSSR